MKVADLVVIFARFPVTVFVAFAFFFGCSAGQFLLNRDLFYVGGHDVAVILQLRCLSWKYLGAYI